MAGTKTKRTKVLVGGGSSRVRSIRLPVAYWRELKKIARKNRTSVNGEISLAVQTILRDTGAIE